MKLTETQEKLEKCGSGPPLDAAERLGFLIDVSCLAVKTLHLLRWI